MQNMKKVIEATRVELAQYWDQCFYSQEQRQAFAPYYAGSYKSDLRVTADVRRHVLPLLNRYGCVFKPFSINCHSYMNTRLQMLLGSKGFLDFGSGKSL